MNEYGFEWITALKKQTGAKSVTDLLVLSRDHDPVFCGTPAHLVRAKWFARMWEREYKGQTGIHLRRIHYHLDAIQFKKPHGMPYRNTKDDWNYLTCASLYARTLRLVPAEAFDDHRNQDPYALHWKMANVRAPESKLLDRDWNLPSLQLDGLSLDDWTLATPIVDGYEPDDYLDRAYLLELFIEKSTMDDILAPLARELGIRLVPSSGYQSVSNAVKLLKRIHETQKPARIFYISDYDKAGRQMPIAVARQIEYWRKQYAPGADVKLIILALTKAQITEYDLPSSIDKKDAVELDALEALRPGELEKIVRAAVEPYLDQTIGDRLEDAEDHARRLVRAEWAQVTAPHKERLEVLRKRVDRVTKKYRKRANDLNKRLQQELAPLRRPLDRLRKDADHLASKFDPDLPERPQQSAGVDEGECLYDSSRPYLKQLEFYKSQQGRE